MPRITFNNNNNAKLSSNVPNLTGTLSNTVIQVGSSADMSNYYDKEEVDGLLENKSDIVHDHYVKIGLLNYNLQEAITNLHNNKLGTYEVNKLISQKAAPIDHEHEEYALKTELPSTEGLASTSYVDEAINTALGNVEQELDEIIGEVE